MLTDIRLLSEIYSQNVITESPDEFNTDVGQLIFENPKAVPFFVYNNFFVMGKVFGTTHNGLFSKALVNNYMNLPLDCTKGEVLKMGLQPEQIKFNPNNDFITDVDSRGCFNVKSSAIQELFSEANRQKKLQILTFPEFYVELIKDVVKYLNMTKTRQVYAPCGRAWIGPSVDPDNIYISYWPSSGRTAIPQAQKNATKKAVADLIRKYPNAFKIRDGYNFIFEDGEEGFDPATPHIETNPQTRRDAMIAKGVPFGSSKEADVAKGAGYNTVASFKKDKIIGDSYITKGRTKDIQQ